MADRHLSPQFSPAVLAAFVFIYFVCTALVYGASVPSGLFIPCMLIGSGFGRLVGELLASAGAAVDPGIYALIGAAGFLGGVTRMTMSLAAIVIEVSNDIGLVLPVMIAIGVAKQVGDRLTHSLYDIHIGLLGIPMLGTEWVLPKFAFGLLNARSVMEKKVLTLKAAESPAKLRQVLETSSHHGFPITLGDSGLFHGMIWRSSLEALLLHHEEEARLLEEKRRTPIMEALDKSNASSRSDKAKVKSERTKGQAPTLDGVLLDESRQAGKPDRQAATKAKRPPGKTRPKGLSIDAALRGGGAPPSPPGCRLDTDAQLSAPPSPPAASRRPTPPPDPAARPRRPTPPQFSAPREHCLPRGVGSYDLAARSRRQSPPPPTASPNRRVAAAKREQARTPAMAPAATPQAANQSSHAGPPTTGSPTRSRPISHRGRGASVGWSQSMAGLRPIYKHDGTRPDASKELTPPPASPPAPPGLIDLRPHCDRSPYVVNELLPLRRVFRLFTTMGMRHLAVVDAHSCVVGIITRKDFLKLNTADDWKSLASVRRAETQKRYMEEGRAEMSNPRACPTPSKRPAAFLARMPSLGRLTVGESGLGASSPNKPRNSCSPNGSRSVPRSSSSPNGNRSFAMPRNSNRGHSRREFLWSWTTQSSADSPASPAPSAVAVLSA